MEQRKHPLETQDFTLPWDARLAGETIASSSSTSTPILILGSQLSPDDVEIVETRVTATSTVVRIRKGVNRRRYTIQNTVQTSSGRTLITSFTVRVTDQMFPIPPGTNPWLSGLRLEDAQGRLISQYTLMALSSSALGAVELKLGTRFEPTVIKCGRYAQAGDVAPISTRDMYSGRSYNPDGNRDARYHFMNLPVSPMRTDSSNKPRVLSFGLWLPGQDKVIPYATDWVHPEERRAKAQIYPGKSLNAPVLSGYVGSFPTFGLNNTIPGAWHICYEAGYSNEDLQQMPDLLVALQKAAALEVFRGPGSMDCLFQKGIAGSKSASVDGLSQVSSLIQNVNSLKYQPMINQLEKDLADYWQLQRQRRQGPRFGVV